MSAAIAIFVKTPSLSPVKTRLAASIGENKAKAFYVHSVAAVEETVMQVRADIFWAVGEEGGLADPLWSKFEAIYTGAGDLGARQHHVYERLLDSHGRVLLIGSDAPQLSPEILEEAVQALNDNDFVIGPARDGGYYLFGGRLSLDENIWNSVPWSTDKTREGLEDLLSSKPCQLPFLTDVDMEGDLASMVQEMPETMSDAQKKLAAWVSS